MKLTDEEKRMLDGAEGEAARMGMEVLVNLSKIYDADKFVQIGGAHVAAVYPHLGAIVEMMEKFAEEPRL